jgi:hypothetical protein
MALFELMGTTKFKTFFVTDLKQADDIIQTVITSNRLDAMGHSKIYPKMAFWNSTGDERALNDSITVYIPLTIMTILKRKYQK